MKKMVIWLLLLAALPALAGNLGVFQSQGDIGNPARAGQAQYVSSSHGYVVSGGGENMWFTNDAFHFLWKRVSGDFALEASISWLEQGGNAHRKACLLVRQGLAPDSPYVDVAVHGNGLTSLQFRDRRGGMTREIQASQSAPARIGIQRQGQTFFMLLPSRGSGLIPSGAFIRLRLTDPVYVGIGVCAHDDTRIESARFSGLELSKMETLTDQKPVLHCSLEVVPIASKDRRLVYHTVHHIEAPNWSKDGRYLLFNSEGHIYRLPVAGGEPEQIDTGSANHCNNDHGLSPDGKRLAISDQSEDGKSRIYILPSAGGTPRQITPLGPSYFHGWSPDGSTLAYCAERHGEFDVYTIPANGGEERRLTTAQGLDDGPDYTADGRYIYFNSVRTGLMQIWRMKPDGSQQEQVTFDDYNNWFAHPSPDGKWLVFLSYQKGVEGHPADQPVKLRLMQQAGGPIQDLARLFGGQGTINVPSWSPDSRQVAFVSYELIYASRPASAPE